MKLILVHWLDSHSGRGWRNLEDIKECAKVLPCKSVGWLAFEDDNCVTVIPHIYDEKSWNIYIQGCGEMTIPNEAIKKITVLLEVEE